MIVLRKPTYEELEKKVRKLKHTEAALKKSETCLRTLVRTLPDLVWLKDQQGNYLFCNSRFEDFFGAKEAEIIGKTDYDFVDKEIADFFIDHDRLALDKGCPSKNEEEVTFANDGHREVLETIKIPMYDEDGRLAGVLGIGRDITERKRAEEEQRVLYEVLRLINEAEDWETLLYTIIDRLKDWSDCDAVGIRLKDKPDFPYFTTKGFPEHFVRMENHLCAYDKNGDVLRDGDGQPILDCMCGNILCGKFDSSKNFYTADGSFWSNCTTELLATTTDEDRQARTRNRCNGEGYESVALIPLRCGKETFGLIQYNDKRKGRFTPERIAMYRHIADRIANFLAKKQADARIVHLNNILRGIRDVNKLIITEKDRNRLIQKACNLLVKARGFNTVVIGLTNEPDQRLQEYARSGQKLAYIQAMLDRGEIPACAQQAMTRGEITTNRVQDGSCGRCPTVVTLESDRDTLVIGLVNEGRSYGFMMTCLSSGMADSPEEQDLLREVAGDIAFALRGLEVENERDRSVADLAFTQEQFRQAQKMEAVGRLAGGVAHDYNNMLSVIIGYAELALDKVPSEDPLHADLMEILHSGKRSTEITRQLLAFARKQTISPRVLDLNETVESMLKMLRRLIGEDINLSWNPRERIWPVNMDPTQIDQILANLCVNARDAIADVGKITIESGRTTFDAEYCAAHAGFVPGDFVMLAVSDNGCGMDSDTLNKIFEPFFTTKKIGQGTGLGLATVYGIVKQNEGFINVYSEPGNGTTFKIYLPRHMGQCVAEPADSEAEIPGGQGEILLVVEDDPSILKLTTRLLEGFGYQVLQANSPIDALQLATAHTGDISLLITDVVMPGMNGRELCKRLEVTYPRLKCLFMSGYTASVIAHRGILEEGLNFIQKPFSKKELAIKVRTALEEN